MQTHLEQLYKVAPLYQELFDKQLELALAPNRLLAALCSSRAGKTTVCGIIGIQELLDYPRSLGFYLALTKDSVRDIFLPTIRPLLAKYNIKCTITQNRITFSNGSVLVISGADNAHVVETFRGLKLRFCIIDEAASFNQKLLQYLIDEVIMLRLADLQGKLMLIGSPAAHCQGVFYDITNGSEPGWTTFQWGMNDNPYMKGIYEKEVALFFLRKDCGPEHPKFRREYLGFWAADDEELMIKPFKTFDPGVYDQNTWRSCIGVDFGFNDETAFSVIGWKHNNPIAYVLETWGKSGLSVSEIANKLVELKTKYNPVKIVGDPAGASKIMMQEFLHKYKVFMEPAQKQDKAHYIEILNDALILNVLLLHPDNTKELAKEFLHVVWNEEHTREMEGLKCDHLDATIYCYRAVLAYTEKIIVFKKETPKEQEDNWLKMQVELDQQRFIDKKGDTFFDDVSAVLED